MHTTTPITSGITRGDFISAASVNNAVAASSMASCEGWDRPRLLETIDATPATTASAIRESPCPAPTTPKRTAGFHAKATMAKAAR